MSQEKTNEKEWEVWMDNLIIKDTLRKENIPFYQYSEFEDVKLISGNVYKATFKTSQRKTVALKCISLNDKFTLNNLINENKRYRRLQMYDSILRFYGLTKQDIEDCKCMIVFLDSMALQSKNSENILIHNGSIKLNVFGITKIGSEFLRFLTNTLGSIQSIDPQYLEISNTIGKNKSSDIFSLGIVLWEISSGTPPFEMESLSNVDLLNNIIKGKREMVIPGTPFKYKEIYMDCWKHDGNSRPDVFQVVKNLSKIIISDASFENETPQSRPHNVKDEIISVKSEKLNVQKVNSDPLFVNKLAEVEVFIKDLFEFFIDVIKNQFLSLQPIMIENYIKEHKKSSVEVLNEMISHPSHSWFTSMIGFFYNNGIGTVTDNQMALKFFSIAANETFDASSSNPSRLMKLYNINKEFGSMFFADMHLIGEGVEKNVKKAYRIYSNLAKEGSFIALTEIACYYENGLGVEKNDEKAFKLYLKSAEKGILVAQYKVGCCYFDGIGTPKDAAKGFFWYGKSALGGNIGAMCKVGDCYCNGIGVDRDYQKAFKWFLKAAEKGESTAQYCLGKFCENGYVVNENQVKAFEWYKKAAEFNCIYGQYEVGRCLYEGRGTKRDIVNAIYWLNKSKENGDIESNELLNEIISDLI
ncbi:hypothetical protein Glove_23g86 [Diversispora epigaea]|uniref:Protein kinase domain-containing protein n=1 Tax=Diversispora epigaea TaxID=1348612 RepID=A0A397JL08_9GLOM|nr:hypothetical protein Glove_23g86 [Diversispora epigaea]